LRTGAAALLDQSRSLTRVGFVLEAKHRCVSTAKNLRHHEAQVDPGIYRSDGKNRN
jgi:hypothetical protein